MAFIVIPDSSMTVAVIKTYLLAVGVTEMHIANVIISIADGQGACFVIRGFGGIAWNPSFPGAEKVRHNWIYNGDHLPDEHVVDFRKPTNEWAYAYGLFVDYAKGKRGKPGKQLKLSPFFSIPAPLP